MKKSKSVALFGLMIALAFTLSFLESLVPINIGIPGVKVGFANIVVLATLFILGKKEAFAVSMIRILLSGLLFSGAFSLLYSFSGGILSFVVMLLLYKSDRVSIIGTAIAGAVTHNVAQLLVAAVVVETYRIAYYIPVLLFSGAVAGAVVGIISGIIVDKLSKIKLK